MIKKKVIKGLQQKPCFVFGNLIEFCFVKFALVLKCFDIVEFICSDHLCLKMISVSNKFIKNLPVFYLFVFIESAILVYF